ncbi:hypothetical protein J7438_10480 [Thalassotalea sp. G20_0]|uniref:hypothetical protein n=1 Tax=Thalassotalea sp. G20_0 TaxID=2821093 RepID=UPI001ADB7571|nr:hypothetical protein [Thalassotalea sp. G20_0]MBO9494511.1 hypothetical protein [Thalassotalea sp. G20_0]
MLKAYRNDSSTIRSGFFLQKLCLQNILHDDSKVTPDQVIQEFRQKPDQHNKYQLAIARFRAECCLRYLPLHGQQVTPEQVVRDYQAVRARLELARFKEECCLRGLALNDRQVTPDVVIKDFQAVGATLELAHFKAECCLRNLALNGQQVTPGEVVKDFPDSPKGKLGLMRFKEECCLKRLPLNGQQVTPDAVIKGYQTARTQLELARFKEECCLRGLMLNDQQVTPDAVVKDYQTAKATLELARFKAECCLRGLTLHGQQVSPDSVVKDFQATRATLELALFKQQCCLRGLLLNGQKVNPDSVVKDFPDSPEGKLGITRFKAECCLRGLTLNGQQISLEAVVKGFQESQDNKLGVARFKAECCLRGLTLNGRQVTADMVVKCFPGSLEGKLGIARFKAECCLRGLTLNGQPVTADMVVKCFPGSPEGKLGIARFKEQCCLRGLALNGQNVTPDTVVKHFLDSPDRKMGIARFKAECCLRGLPLNGQPVTPEAVVNDYQAARATLALGRFKAECCLRGLPLNGQQVTPEAVVNDYQAAKATLELARFKEQCCLRGMLLNGQPVKPEAVVKDYERGGWLLERAIFYTQLTLSARELNGHYLDNREVLAAFNEAPGDYSAKQARYLIQSLTPPQQFDETSDTRSILQEAWHILNNVMVKDDEQHRLQCIVQFMAMQHGLPIDHQRVSAEQVLQSIRTLRRSFQNSRLHFFFLTYCYITGQSIDGRKITKHQALECLQSFPAASKLCHALGCWFAQYCCDASTMDELLFDSNRHSANRAIVGQTLKQRLTTGDTGFLQKQVSRFTALTLKTLEIIQEINDSYTNPPMLITGSYARFLQNLCSSFNDIDIICTQEAPARTLFDRLQALNTDSDSEIPKNIIIRPIRGCQAIKLPHAYNIQFNDGDLGMKAMVLQISIVARVAHEQAIQLPVHVPGVERPVWCLSFAEETRLLNDTLEYLANNLDLLTEQLQKGTEYLPRTILFNLPQTPDERIYGLFMRCLLSLNKARQFIALQEAQPKQPDGQTNHLQEQQHRLPVLTETLQIKLTSHACRKDFEHRINDWLATTHHVNDYEFKRKDFIKTLLAIMNIEKTHKLETVNQIESN